MSTTARDALLGVLKTKGLRRLPEPVKLASGEWSQDFIDGKEALAHWRDLRLAAEATVEAVREAGIEFDAVGGLELGACAYAVAVAAVADCKWFFVRKQPKDRGTRRWVEGAQLTTERVLLVEDVLTTGGSLLKAYHQLLEACPDVRVVGAATLVDRGEQARPKLAGLGVPYFPLATYASLGIDPVGPTS